MGLEKSRSDSSPEPEILARKLMRQCLKGSLATIDSKSGSPYASLITIACEPDVTPIFLISTLALHTQNILQDRRVSILFDGTNGLGDPLRGGRVSVFGRAEKTDGSNARFRFLARHPSAEFYAGFDDFAFYRLHVEGAHYIGGFGAIHDINRQDLVLDVTDATALIEAEPEIIAHMNEDHKEAIELYTDKLLAGIPGLWRFSGCDPEGCDFVLEDKTLRLDFPNRVTNPLELRRILTEMVQMAKTTGSGKPKPAQMS